MEVERSQGYKARERLRHLDYNSTYLDYAALSSSEKSASSTDGSLLAGDSRRVMDSIHEGEEGREEEQRGEGGGGWLGTLSSLLSSTFRRTS